MITIHYRCGAMRLHLVLCTFYYHYYTKLGHIVFMYIYYILSHVSFREPFAAAGKHERSIQKKKKNMLHSYMSLLRQMRRNKQWCTSRFVDKKLISNNRKRGFRV
jgi:hypothetical protein